VRRLGEFPAWSRFRIEICISVTMSDTADWNANAKFPTIRFGAGGVAHSRAKHTANAALTFPVASGHELAHINPTPSLSKSITAASAKLQNQVLSQGRDVTAERFQILSCSHFTSTKPR